MYKVSLALILLEVNTYLTCRAEGLGENVNNDVSKKPPTFFRGESPFLPRPPPIAGRKKSNDCRATPPLLEIYCSKKTQPASYPSMAWAGEIQHFEGIGRAGIDGETGPGTKQRMTRRMKTFFHVILIYLAMVEDC